MTSHACPVCGDPTAYPCWVDPEPPAGCPNDAAWMRGDAPTVRSITDCPWQMARARQMAERRRVCPQAFDDHGNIKPGGLAMVLAAMARPTQRTSP